MRQRKLGGMRRGGKKVLGEGKGGRNQMHSRRIEDAVTLVPVELSDVRKFFVKFRVDQFRR